MITKSRRFDLGAMADDDGDDDGDGGEKRKILGLNSCTWLGPHFVVPHVRVEHDYAAPRLYAERYTVAQAHLVNDNLYLGAPTMCVVYP